MSARENPPGEVRIQTRHGGVRLDVALTADERGAWSGRARCVVGSWTCGGQLAAVSEPVTVSEFLVSIRLYLDRLLRGQLPESEGAPGVLSARQRAGVAMAMGVLP